MVKSNFVFRLVIVISTLFPALEGSAGEPGGSVSGDSLLFPTEVFVITREELLEYNVHTLDDILEILPGVALWREGPHGARSGFSIDGRSPLGVTLFVNGEPFCDPYSHEALSRFIPLSRLKRVEVVYSGSPFVTGDICSNGAVNLVMEEGGREGPIAVAGFTYGRNNRRARRIWFSTPRSSISAALAYDEYLQDAFVAFAAKPTLRIGDYDSRSTLMDLSIVTDSGDDLLVRFQRFEDTYLGTAYSAKEDVRYDGFDSRIRYRRGRFSAMFRQRGLSLSRSSGRISSLLRGGSVGCSASIGGVSLRTFVSAEHCVLENVLWGLPFEPTFHRIEGGVTAGDKASHGLLWRAGLFGGSHSEAGGYVGGEAGVVKGWKRGFSQSLMVSRRVRTPSVRELFQPETERTPEGIDYSTSGSDILGPEIADELTLGTELAGSFTVDLFARKERSRITLSGSAPAIFSTEGAGYVSGARGRFRRAGDILGFSFDYSIGFEFFGKRSSFTRGIPEYRLNGGVLLRRRVFKDNETFSMRWDTDVAGDRLWEDFVLGPYVVNNVSASITVLSAVIRVQVKNLFNTEYETVPGFLMPGRHYLFGVLWELPD